MTIKKTLYIGDRPENGVLMVKHVGKMFDYHECTKETQEVFGNGGDKPATEKTEIMKYYDRGVLVGYYYKFAEYRDGFPINEEEYLLTKTPKYYIRKPTKWKGKTIYRLCRGGIYSLGNDYVSQEFMCDEHELNDHVYSELEKMKIDRKDVHIEWLQGDIIEVVF